MPLINMRIWAKVSHWKGLHLKYFYSCRPFYWVLFKEAHTPVTELSREQIDSVASTSPFVVFWLRFLGLCTDSCLALLQRTIESMMVLRPTQGNLKQVFRLFSLMRGFSLYSFLLFHSKKLKK